MKKILLTSAAMALLAGAASAQSVLERVLAQTDALGQVTGVFANVADNIGTGGTVTTYSVSLTDAQAAALGLGAGATANADTYTLSEEQYASLNLKSDYTALADDFAVNEVTGAVITLAEYNLLSAEAKSQYILNDTGATVYYQTSNPAAGTINATTYGNLVTADAFTPAVSVGLGAGTINGSITNIVTGLDEVQASVMGTVTAVDVPTVNFGNMATTVLGAVNTGEIGLGTNQVVEEALAGTTQAIRSEIQQVGTLAGLTQVALNSALNTMNINGSISTTLSGVNGSVAAVSPDVLEIAMSASDTLSLTGVADLLGSMETTVLGAVNTGTIVSGVNNQVDGTVAGIVGNSATNMFGDAAQ